MKTITIEDPAEAQALLEEAFPKSLYNAACYESHKSGGRWSLIHCAYFEGFPTFHGYGSTIAEAVSDLRAKVAAHDPLLVLRKSAAEHGMQLVPLTD